MDAPESPVNRIGRTIWTVWGYLSGAVARYLRPEVTDEGNQRVCSRSDQIDLSAANKINREEKANSSEKEENISSHNDKSTGEVKCSLAKVKVQVASVQWEKTDVVKDDKNVDTARKQTYSCAMWSAGTDHEGSISGDSESRECKSGTHVEKEVVSSDEGQAESVHANSKASEIIQELDETGRIEQNDGNNEEYDQKYEDENCSKKREDPDNADVTVQSELYGQDVEQEKEIMMDHGETESIGGFEQAGFIDEMEKETVGPKERLEIEIDEDQGPELQVPGDAFEEEADGLSNTERLKVIEKYCDEIAEFCKNEVEEMIPENKGATESEQDTIKLQESWDTESDTHVENEEVSSNEVQAERGHADIECKESETALELDQTGQIEQKDDNDEECDQNHEDEKCEMTREDPDNADVTVQSELYGQDVEQEKEIMMDHGETESSGGFEHAGFIDEMEKETVGPKERVEIEIDEDQGPELQVPGDAFEEEADGLSNTERLKVIEKCDDEIAEFCKNEVEEMIPENRGATESEQDTIKSELQESAETLQTVPKEINILNIETELKMTVNTSEDSLQFDSKQDTPENTSETGTGLPVVMAIKTEGMFSYPIVCEFPGESRKRPETALGCFEEIKSEPQSLAEEQSENETFVARSVEHPETPKAVEEAVEIEQDIETPIESVSTIESQTHQEIDNTKFSLKKRVEFKTELIVETTETKICFEDEEAEPYETQSQSSNIRNVTLQTRELLEFTERERKSSQEAMDTFSESLGNSGVSVITGTAEIQHVVDDQTDAKPVLIQTLSPAEFLEETLDLQGESEQEQETRDTDVAKIALEYVEEITNQVLKDMIEMENNLVKETETLEGVSTEELGDAEYQAPEECVSVGAFVLEEERKLLGETMGSIMAVETTSREVAVQNEQDVISQECKTTEADQQSYLCAGTDHGGSSSEDVSSDEVQDERVYANSKDSEIVQELDETGRIEQKDGNNEEYDQKYEDENCSKKREGPDNADVTVQSELYGQDVEQEKEIMMDHGETESSGGFEQAGFIDEMEKETVGLKERVETEIDEGQGPELQVPGDAFEEEADGLSNTERLKVIEKYCDEIAEFCKNEVEEMIPENRGATESEQDTIKLQESWDTESDTHVENEEVSSNEVQAERGHADIECKDSETALELDQTGQIEQKDDIDEECDQNHEDKKCQMKSEDPDDADVTVQSELYRQDVEQEKEIMMDHGETESSGGLRHAGENLIDENEKNIVDQNDHEKAEIDEDQGPELQVPADAFVLEEGRKLLGETMEVEKASREAVKHIEPQSSPECETNEADGRHDQMHESSGHEDFMEVSRPGMKRRFDRVNPPVVKIEGTFDLNLQAFEDSSLDFSVQKSRIAVKNPLVRPPKDPRKLLFKISVEPRLPQPPACEVSAPSKGVIGFKLPGLGAGLPALRKTEFGKKAREEGEAERTLHPQLKSVAVTEDSVKREPASAKPKWTPPKHPGMGSPLMMAELKNKLKKPVKE